MHVGKFFARNLGSLIRARTGKPGRFMKATSRTPSMYVDEKSDEAIVPWKRSNNGRQLPAEVVEGRAFTQGKQPTGGRGSDTEPRYHVDPIAAVHRSASGFKPHAGRRLTRGRSPVR